MSQTLSRTHFLLFTAFSPFFVACVLFFRNFPLVSCQTTVLSINQEAHTHFSIGGGINNQTRESQPYSKHYRGNVAL